MRVPDALPTAKGERGQGREDPPVPSKSLLSPQQGANQRPPVVGLCLVLPVLRLHRNTAYRLHLLFALRFSVRSCRFVVCANFLHQPPLRKMPPKSSKKSWRKTNGRYRRGVQAVFCARCAWGCCGRPLVRCKAAEAAHLCPSVHVLPGNQFSSFCRHPGRGRSAGGNAEGAAWY